MIGLVANLFWLLSGNVLIYQNAAIKGKEETFNKGI